MKMREKEMVFSNKNRANWLPDDKQKRKKTQTQTQTHRHPLFSFFI
jgi:hypothetical protein